MYPNNRFCGHRGASNEAPGVLGNRGIRPFISGEQGNKSLKLKRTWEQKHFLEQGT